MVQAIAPYRKLLAYLLGITVAGLGSFATDDVITGAELLQLALMLVTAIGVYTLPDTPEAPYVKLVFGAIGAGLTVVVAALNSGEPLDTSAWFNVAVAVATMLGLIGTQPAEPAVPPTATTEAKALPPAQGSSFRG
jgi:tetrahydromethanopterin S-methyltransferase subunit E